MRQVRDRPMRSRVQDLLFCPCAGKEKRNTAEIHHADDVSEEGDRHQPAEPTHLADVLFVMASVNDRAGTEKQERFEEAVCDQVHDAGSDTTNAEGDHHQSQLGDGGVGENAFDVELGERDERSHQGCDYADPYDHSQRRCYAIDPA